VDADNLYQVTEQQLKVILKIVSRDLDIVERRDVALKMLRVSFYSSFPKP
jgi:hypothetical protein